MSVVVPTVADDVAGGSPRKDGLGAIKQDHEVIRGLFREYKAISPSDTVAKLEKSRQVVTAISQHASAEERMLYPLVKKHWTKEEGSALLYDMMVMDDQINKEFLALFERHTPQTPADWQLFDMQMDKFIAVEEEHLGKEERTVIDPLAGKLSVEEKDAMWHEWDKALKNAPLHPHPWGGSTALPAQILHPIAGVVDKAAHAVGGAVQKLLGADKEKAAAHQGVAAGMHTTGAA